MLGWVPQEQRVPSGFAYLDRSGHPDQEQGDNLLLSQLSNSNAN